MSTFATVVATSLVALSASTAQAEEVTPKEGKVSAWLPYWDSRALKNFTEHRDLYDQVLPFWYEMRSAANVVAYPGAEDPAVIDAARAAQVAVLPTVTNDFDPERLRAMLSSDVSMDLHVKVLTDIARRFDGIDIDYESGYGTDRARFSEFTRRLAASVHAAGKQLSMTLHPKTSEPGTWDGPQSQDWAAIGAAADRVRVMAYDYHWATSEAGGVAPLSWVRSVAAFAAKAMPANKVSLGMPLYGYDWVSKKGEGVTWDTAEAIRQRHNASLQRSSDGSEPWFRYNSAGQSHTVWYSDAVSTTAKLDVVDTYGLRGATFWRLGGEDPAVWPAVRNWTQTIKIQIDETPPTRVGTLDTNRGKRRVRVKWASSQDESAVRYQVWRATSKRGKGKRVAVVEVLKVVDRGLVSKRRYWYRVRPIDAANNFGKFSPRVRTRPY